MGTVFSWVILFKHKVLTDGSGGDMLPIIGYHQERAAMTSTSPLSVCMEISAYDWHTGDGRSFDVISEALAWGRQRAAALNTQLGFVVAPHEEPTEYGVMFMGQVQNEDGNWYGAEPLVRLTLEMTPGMDELQS